jgi:uncharacterized protein (TIGR02118 family)
MISYFVRYRGTTADPSGFAERYATTHASILQRFPTIRALVLHRAVVCIDPFPTNSGGTLLLAQMQFDTLAHLDTALQSPARRDARADFNSFPAFTGEVTHEAMQARIIF